MESMSGTRPINIGSEVSRTLNENKNCIEVSIKKQVYNLSNCGGVDENKTKNRLKNLVESNNITRNLCQKNCGDCPVKENEPYVFPVIPESPKNKTWVIGYMPTPNSGMIRVPFSDGIGLLFRDIFETKNMYPYYTYICKCCCVNPNNEVVTDCMERYLLRELSIGQPHFIFCLDVPVISMIQKYASIIEQQSSSKFICNIQGVDHPVTIFSLPDFTKISNIPNDSILRVRADFEKILTKIIGGTS